MRQLNKEIYEAPLTTRRVVMMEDGCMATSNTPVVHDDNTSADITKQEGGDDIFFQDIEWTKPHTN